MGGYPIIFDFKNCFILMARAEVPTRAHVRALTTGDQELPEYAWRRRQVPVEVSSGLPVRHRVLDLLPCRCPDSCLMELPYGRTPGMTYQWSHWMGSSSGQGHHGWKYVQEPGR